ncbi:MAG: hypothetical protein ACXW15_08430, partial [Acidimicrobiia bacterium]
AMRGETEAVRKGHAVYFRRLAEDALPHLRGPDENVWLDHLETEHDNLRQALRWTIDAREIDLAQGLAGTLYRFWMIRSHVDEGRAWLAQVLAMGDEPSKSRARALLGAGTLALTHNDLIPARRYLEDAVAELRATDDVQLASAAMHNLAQVLFSMADYAAAAALTKEELSVAERHGDRDSAAFALLALGQLDFARGDLTGGIDRMTAAIEVSRATRSIELLGNTLTLTVMELLVVDQIDLATRFAIELDALGRSSNAPGRHLVISGMVLARRGEVVRGLTLMKEGIANFRTIRGYEKLAGALRGVFDEWAGLEFDTGAVERGATLLGGAQLLIRDATRLPHEQAVFDRRRHAMEIALGPVAFEQAWQRGMSFSFDELLDFAIGS